VAVRSPIAVKDAKSANIVKYEYEQHGKVWRATQAPGAGDDEEIEVFFYDGAGNRTGRMDGLRNITVLTYDGLGRVVREELPNLSTITHGYDKNSNTISETLEGDAGPHFRVPILIGGLFPVLVPWRTTLRSKTTLHDEWNRPYCEKEQIFDLEQPKQVDIRQVQHVYNDDGMHAQEIRPRLEGDYIVTMQYDGAHRQTYRGDSLGNYTSFEYYDSGRIKKQVDFDVSTKDGGTNALATEFLYDKLGRVIFTGIGSQQAYERYYDSFGNARLTIDPLGRKAEFQYDPASRLVRSGEAYQEYDIAEPYGPITGASLVVRDTGIVWTINSYDDNSRLISVEKPEGITRYFYDDHNRLHQVFEGQTGQPGVSLANLRIRYDKAGMPFQIVDAENTEVLNSRDAMGNIVTRQISPVNPDPLHPAHSSRERYVYDGAARLVIALDEQNDTYEAYTYDSADNYRQEVHGITRSHVWVPDGKLDYTLAFQTSLSATKFDEQGFRQRMSVRFGDQTSAAALHPGQPGVPAFQEGRTFNYQRDPLGRVKSMYVSMMQSQSVNLANTYFGPNSRLHGQTVNGAAPVETSYTYNRDRTLTQFEHSHTSALSRYSFLQSFRSDPVGNLQSRSQFDARFGTKVPARQCTDGFRYDNRYQLIGESRGDDGTGARLGWTMTSYNRAALPVASVHADHDPSLTPYEEYFPFFFIGEWALWGLETGGELGGPIGALAGTVLAGAGAFVMLLKAEGENGLRPNKYYRGEESITPDYPRLDRIAVKTAILGTADTSAIPQLSGRGAWQAKPPTTTRFQYDKRGNLTAVIKETADPADPNKVISETIKEFRYDYRGRLIFFLDHQKKKLRQTAAFAQSSFRYDTSNRLVEIRQGDARTRRFAWDREQLLEEIEDVSGKGMWRSVRRYVWSPTGDHLVAYQFRSHDDAQNNSTFETFFVCCDPQGTVLYLTDYWGDTVEAYDITTGADRRIVSRAKWSATGLDFDSEFRFDGDTPVEDQLYHTSPLFFPYGFGGHYTDAISDLVYMRNRWYSPDLNRFLSRDPVDMAGNRYLYAGNNSSSAADHTGGFAVRVLMWAAGHAMRGAAKAGVMAWLNEPYHKKDWNAIGTAALQGAVLEVLTAGIHLSASVLTGGIEKAIGGGVGGFIFGKALGRVEGLATEALYSKIDWSFDGDRALASLQEEGIGGYDYVGAGAKVSRGERTFHRIRTAYGYIDDTSHINPKVRAEIHSRSVHPGLRKVRVYHGPAYVREYDRWNPRTGTAHEDFAAPLAEMSAPRARRFFARKREQLRRDVMILSDPQAYAVHVPNLTEVQWSPSAPLPTTGHVGELAAGFLEAFSRAQAEVASKGRGRLTWLVRPEPSWVR
ncbi:MAG TPA: RHS repeat-associated core domain-containing protein, partial [Blastocatellia bacterium]|nr:RHS repeat-associated core domain-containing protein [Blastocatellia bacterium]